MGLQAQTTDQKIVLFSLDETLYALPLNVVDGAVRAVTVTPLNQVPDIVLGIINVRGRIVPVIDTRRRFGLPLRQISLNDQFLLAFCSRRLVALVVDLVKEVHELDGKQIESSRDSLPFAPNLKGVAKLPDGLILIHDLERFLSLDEQRALDEAMAE